MAGEKNYFCNQARCWNPASCVLCAGLELHDQRSRAILRFRFPCPNAIHCLPGDASCSKTVTGPARFELRRHQTRWGLQASRLHPPRPSFGYRTGRSVLCFAPVEMQMDLADVPAEVDLDKGGLRGRVPGPKSDEPLSPTSRSSCASSRRRQPLLFARRNRHRLGPIRPAR